MIGSILIFVSLLNPTYVQINNILPQRVLNTFGNEYESHESKIESEDLLDNFALNGERKFNWYKLIKLNSCT